MQSLEFHPAIASDDQFSRRRRLKRYEEIDWIVKTFAKACAGSLLVLFGVMCLALLAGSCSVFRHYGLEFISTWEWVPSAGKFGALSSLYGTVVSTVVALILAIPLSLAIALFLVELAQPAVRRIVGGAIELLAAVPGIIFGMWGVFVLVPLMSEYIQPLLTTYLGFLPIFQGPQTGVSLLTAGMILALMIIPFMSVVMRDVFVMIPDHLKEAGYSMGATMWEVTRDVTFRQGRRGIVAACLLGVSRAMGETMAVAFVIGNKAVRSTSLFAPGHTLTSRVVNEFTGASDPLHVSALMGLGVLLFLMTFSVQVVTQLWLRRFEQKMGEEYSV